MSKQIKVFRDVDELADGDVFIAKVSSVEGRKVVVLEKQTEDQVLDYIWETPGLVDTIKEWLEEDYTPNWSDRD